MNHRRYALLQTMLVAVVFAPVLLLAEQPSFAPGRHANGQLKLVNGVPVLTVAGTPQEMGRQIGVLASKTVGQMAHYPKDYLDRHRLGSAWPALVQICRNMSRNFPQHYLAELDEIARGSRLDRDLLLTGNAMFDVRKAFGCSTLLVEPSRSATGGTLLGRNLDFPTLGYLHKYSLVTVYRPDGKHAFASIGFPGLVGTISGMNDAGLALAVLEVYSSKGGGAKSDLTGVPYAMCYRRLLEECTTVDEALVLLRSMKRTTLNNLAICDTKGGGVFEISPKRVEFRKAKGGVCPCTNHFRTEPLAAGLRCWRYDRLKLALGEPKLDAESILAKLHEVNQGSMTLQTMIFEPATLKLHLSIGTPPTTARALKTIDLAELLKNETDVDTE